MISVDNEMGRKSRNFGSKHSLTLSLADDNDNGVHYVCQTYSEKLLLLYRRAKIILHFILINYFLFCP